MYINREIELLLPSSNMGSLDQKKDSGAVDNEIFPGVNNNCIEKTIARHQWISESAYFKAEARFFAAGHELDDWLDAEKEYFEMLITSYLSVCREDGGLSKINLQQLAKSIGVKNPENISQINEMVRAIQKATQKRPCFQSDQSESCQDIDCKWRNECKKLIAEWMR